MAESEHDWVEVQCRASIARLRHGMTAIVDLKDAQTLGLVRGGYLVVIDRAPALPA